MPVSPRKRNELLERMKALGISERDLEESFVRGSGKGGQKVNKTNNAVCLVHRPTGLVIKCHRERDRFLARRALCDELDHRLNGAPSPKQMEAIRARKRGSLQKNISIVQRKNV